MEIRALSAADIPLVTALAYRIWPVAYGAILSPEQIANILARIYTPDNLLAEMEAGHRFWAAYDGDTALGFASGYRDGDAVWVKKLYVLPDMQGKGIGRAFVETIRDAFGPARELRLLVNDQNSAAQAAYERFGFRRAATIPVRMGDFAFTDYLYVKAL